MVNLLDDLTGDARTLAVRPGDVIVVHFAARVSKEEADAIKAKIHAHPALADHDVLVLGAGAQLSVIRPA